MKLVMLFPLGIAVFASDPRIFYSKSFPGSHPPYVEITLERSGKAVYKEAPDDDQPLRFELTPAEAQEIFDLAEKAGRFERPLESGLKVANMGKKTFRWEEGARRHEATFNYTQDLAAQALHDWFERITETEQHFIAVERAVKFDKLGANQAILRLQAAMERNRIVAPSQFLPLLDRVVKNESYLNMARERAAMIAEVIRNPKPKAE